ncbi:MAG: hypothetical protein D6732_12510 [Methanobacteriota archaeon]|nr:MAG: hypothetical protein D6732_12510 [Euryarchaeota archaeon]
MEFKFRVRLFLVLTYFDDIFGPQILSSQPLEIDKKIAEVVCNLMDIAAVGHQEGFIFSNRSFSSQNVFFSLVNQNARGGQTDFLLSLLLAPTYPQVVSVISMDWNSLFDLKDTIEPHLIQFCEDGELLPLQERLEGAMTNLRRRMLETLNFELEILSPESYIVD